MTIFEIQTKLMPRRIFFLVFKIFEHLLLRILLSIVLISKGSAAAKTIASISFSI